MNYHFAVELRHSVYGFEWMGYNKDLGYFYTNTENRKKFYSVSDVVYAIKQSRELGFYDAIVYLVEGNNMYRIKDYNDNRVW